jgi:hypothetical protein
MRIDSFAFGTATVDGVEFGSDLLILPPVVIASWWRQKGHSVAMSDLEGVAVYRPDVLVVGSGVSGMMKVPESTIRELESLDIRVEIYATGEAVERFNDLVEEGEKVAAAVHLTC